MIDCPSALNTSAVTASDSGMASSEMTVVRADSRKANSTMATMRAPSRKASCTLVMEARMNSAWRNSTWGALSPAGRPLASSASAASTSRVTRTVSALGCFWMLTTTAGTPL